MLKSAATFFGLFLLPLGALASGVTEATSSSAMSFSVATKPLSVSGKPAVNNEIFPLLVLANPEPMMFELEGIGLVEVDVTLRQDEGDSRRLITGQLKQNDVVLPYSSVTLIQSDSGDLTGSMRTLQAFWMISPHRDGSDGHRIVMHKQERSDSPQLAEHSPVEQETQALKEQASPWQADKVYSGGELVSYRGGVYKTLWWHKSQPPGAEKSIHNPWVQLLGHADELLLGYSM